MRENIIEKLTSKDDKYACALADNIIAESCETDKWYEYFDDFALLINHEKSLVRNRAIHIVAANARWDEEDRIGLILPDLLSHATDDKPVTARQCIKALVRVGQAKPRYIPLILACFHEADLSKYKESMCPLIKKDMEETEKILTAINSGGKYET